METFRGDYLRLYADSMNTILGVYQGWSVAKLVRGGADPAHARVIKKLSGIYFGTTSATVKQERCRARSSANHHTLESLREIERHVAKLKNKNNAWQLRIGLLQQPADQAAIGHRAKELLAAINGTGVENPKKAVSTRRVKNSTMKDLCVRTSSHLVTQAINAAKAYAEKEHLDLADAICQLILGNATGKVATVTPAVIVPLNPDVLGVTPAERAHAALSLTDGSVMQVKDFTQVQITAFGLALTVNHITGEDLGLFRLDPEDPDARFADAYQRQVLRLINPVCVADGCGVGADYCQPHHVVAFKHGGKTTTSNLTMLCPYDNGRNDDDRDRPLHGHVEKIDGLDMWVPAFGGKPKLNMHPCAQGGAIRLARKMTALNS
ncbi:HNH endonuclease [Corynebacterium glucuronolyticum]|uniref:HNH endonuclease n=1 Tax=Corynebacterium glucuronolyticum TaxID=39791 RepID=A0A7T4JUE4_9CORY|nr:HNH endonuclease signature motif containing protein [Corynebacterium glucuronolyticum]QQB45765.1 HNH endonuclease [Corynebacterium glucuronolyticum]WKD63543.1 hypothetical protein CGLUCO_06450 [Corynebacterium glucuronolyticum DSM 44120]